MKAGESIHVRVLQGNYEVYSMHDYLFSVYDGYTYFFSRFQHIKQGFSSYRYAVLCCDILTSRRFLYKARRVSN